MTLVQVLVDENSAHMSCDFRLTNTVTRRTEDENAHKLVGLARNPSLHGFVGVTGVAHLDGRPVGEWIAARVDTPGISTSAELAELLARDAEHPLSLIQNPVTRRHTFVIISLVGSQVVVHLVSNFEQFTDGQIVRRERAEPTLTVTSIRPKGAQLFTTGAFESVRNDERVRLTTALRAKTPDADLQQMIADVNRTASARTDTVSEGCSVGSLHSDGSGSSRSFLTAAQTGDFLPPDAQHVLDFLRENGLKLNPKIGPDGKPMPVRVEASTFTSAGGNEAYYREQLKLRPSSAELHSNYAAFLAAKNKPAAALAAAKKAVELDPTYLPGVANLADLTWTVAGDAETARSLFKRVIDAGADAAPHALMGYANLLAAADNDYSGAVTQYEQVLAAGRSVIAEARLGSLLIEQGIDPERGYELVTEAAAQAPDDTEVLYRAGFAAFTYANDLDASADLLNRACTLKPTETHIWRTAADICVAKNELEAAAYYYRKAIKRGDDTWDTHQNYGWTLLVLEKRDAAIRHLNRAHRIKPEEPGVLINLAAANWASGNKSRAKELLDDLALTELLPEHEVEFLGIIDLTQRLTPDQDQRLRGLLMSGATGDGRTIKAMAAGSNLQFRERARKLADRISKPT